MELTLVDILKYLKKKYKIYFLLLLIGFCLALFSNQLNSGNKNVKFVILNDQLFWESGIKDNYTLNNLEIKDLRVVERYFSFIETVKLGVYTKLENSLNFSKDNFIQINCKRNAQKRILDCVNNLPDENVEKFIEDNKLVVEKIFDEEIEFLLESIRFRKKIAMGEFKEQTLMTLNIVRDEISSFKTNYNTKVNYKVSSFKPNYTTMTFTAIGPAFIYLVIVIIFFPRQLRVRKK